VTYNVPSDPHCSLAVKWILSFSCGTQNHFEKYTIKKNIWKNQITGNMYNIFTFRFYKITFDDRIIIKILVQFVIIFLSWYIPHHKDRQYFKYRILNYILEIIFISYKLYLKYIKLIF